MLRLSLAGALVALLCAFGQARAAEEPVLPTFDLRADEVFNLVYQLECLPQGDSCPFHALWRERLGWSAEDDAALERRRDVRARYAPTVALDGKLDAGPLMLDAPRMLELKKKLLLAAAGARSLEDYRDRLALVITAADADAIVASTARFLPRFRRFFGAARRGLHARSREVHGFLKDPRVRRVIAQSMSFYEVPADQSRRLQVQLVPLPPDWKGHTRGEQIEHLSTIEIKHEEAAAERAVRGHAGAIAAHELFHFFYGSAAGARARGLADAFAADPDPGAAAAHSLINEGLATALSVVSLRAYLRPEEFQAYLDSGRPWYRHAPIDAAARAVFPLVERSILRGETLYDPAFVPAYIRLLRERMGEGLDRPALKLRTLLMVAEDPGLRRAMQRISGDVAPGRVQSAIPLEAPHIRELWLKHSAQSGVLLVRGKSVEALRAYEAVLGRGIVERVADLRRRHAAFVHTVRRGRQSQIFVLVADHEPDFDQLAARLVGAEAPFDLLALDRPEAAAPR